MASHLVPYRFGRGRSLDNYLDSLRSYSVPSIPWFAGTTGGPGTHAKKTRGRRHCCGAAVIQKAVRNTAPQQMRALRSSDHPMGTIGFGQGELLRRCAVTDSVRTLPPAGRSGRFGGRRGAREGLGVYVCHVSAGRSQCGNAARAETLCRVSGRRALLWEGMANLAGPVNIFPGRRSCTVHTAMPPPFSVSRCHEALTSSEGF